MELPWWGLLIELLVVWILWGIAAAAANAVSSARRGIPEGERGGVSLAPIIPLFPLGFWGAALLTDAAVGPWGTVAVGWFHVVIGLAFFVSIVRDLWRLRELNRQAEPPVTVGRGEP